VLCQSLIYGEVEFRSFAKVLRKINVPKGSVFYDLGSGTGKVRSHSSFCVALAGRSSACAPFPARLQAVFVARFLHDFDKCRGIEILDGLSRAGAVVLGAYENGPFKEYLTLPGGVGLKMGSILEENWSDGDVVRGARDCAWIPLRRCRGASHVCDPRFVTAF